jgi:GMP synthase (glutamine-hydrolysing)
MNVHYFQHVPFEGPANLESWVTGHSHCLTATKSYCGDPLELNL